MGCQHPTRAGNPLPPHTMGSSLAVHITPERQPGEWGAAPGEIGKGGTPTPAPLGCNTPTSLELTPSPAPSVLTHLWGHVGPPAPAHARCSPVPAPAGPAAPAPRASHSRTQLSGGRSQRAPHRFLVLAWNAGICSPAVPSHAGAGQPGHTEPAVHPPARAVQPDSASLPGRSIP